MTIRHIIIEGMDGTGKSTLLDKLLWEFKLLRPARKASTSIGGPVANLDEWVTNDIEEMATRPASVYDRHPLVSEPVYGPICRQRLPGKFNHKWWLDTQTRHIAHHCLLLFCNPPGDVVMRNVLANQDDQMPGVVDNYADLYRAYNTAANAWPGVQLRYDYTRSDTRTLFRYIEMVMGDNYRG